MHTKIPYLLALLCGLIFVFPHLFAYWQNYPNYSHFVIANMSNPTNDESIFYAPRVKEFAESGVFTDSSLAEYKGKWPTPNLDLAAPAFLGTIYSLIDNMDLVYLLTMFFFPMLYFLLFFSFTKKITQSTPLSCVTAVGILFWNELIGYIPPATKAMAEELVHFFLRTSGNLPLTPFVRFYAMLVTYAVFFIAFYLTYLSLEKKKKHYAVAAGIFGGLLFYTYIYYWPIMLGALIFLLALYGAKKDRQKTQLLLINLGIMVILGIPYILNLIAAAPMAGEFLERGNADFTHFPKAALFFGIKFFLLYLAFFYVAKKTPTFAFLSAYYLAGTLFLFTPLILGKSVQLDHVAWKFMNQYLFFMIAYLCAQRRWEKWAMPLTIIILLHATYAQAVFTAETAPYFSLSPAEKEVYSFLDTLVQKNETVLSLSAETNILLQINTKANVYLPFALTTLASERELWERVLSAYTFYHISPEKFREILSTKDVYFTYKRGLAEGKRYGIEESEKANFFYYHFHRRYFWKYSHLPRAYDEKITPEAVSRSVEALPVAVLEEKLSQYAATQPILPYQAQYALLGPYERALGGRIDEHAGKKIYENDDYVVYRIVSG